MTTSPTALARHRLDAVGARWMWHWPIPQHINIDEQKAHGVTGVVPQQSSAATAWAKTNGKALKSAGLEVVIGLGYLTTKIVCDAIDAAKAGHALGVMYDQEVWKSVPDSDALVRDVLKAHPDAADWAADCHYPCLTTNGPKGGHTGHNRIAKAWAPICGIRAPQCYWESDVGAFAPDGWVAKRLAWARLDYPKAGGSPIERVRASVQIYRESVQSHVDLLLHEGMTGGIWLWDWHEGDASSKAALRIAHALNLAGHYGDGAVRSFQSHSGLVVDGLLGPKTAAALGVTDIGAVTWHK